MPRTSPIARCLSSSSLVLSSIARMSSIVSPYQRSVQQNTWLWNEKIKWVNKNKSGWTTVSLPMEVGKQSTFGLLNEVLHSRRNAKPFKLAGHQFVARHHRLHSLHPVLIRQRSASRFTRLKPDGKNVNIRFEKIYSSINLDTITYRTGSSLSL